jgi:hypothetical protein
VIGLALLAVVVAGLAFSGSSGYLRFVTGAPEPGPTATPTPTPTTTTAIVNTTTSGLVTEFDPYGNHNDPHVSEAPRAVDGNPTTAWRTQIYRTADLGKLKPGVGLLVHLVLVGSGTSVELFDSTGDTAPTSEKAMNPAASQANAPSDVTLRPDDPTSARYWMIWLTRLPATGAGFQGGIAEMTFLP